MAMAHTRIVRELATMAIGEKINSMVKALKRGLRELNMLVTMSFQRKRAQENIHGLTVAYMMDNGMIIKLMVLASIFGKTVANTMATGLIMT